MGCAHRVSHWDDFDSHIFAVRFHNIPVEVDCLE